MDARTGETPSIIHSVGQLKLALQKFKDEDVIEILIVTEFDRGHVAFGSSIREIREDYADIATFHLCRNVKANTKDIPEPIENNRNRR